MEHVFETRMDKTSKILTVGIAALFVGIALTPLLSANGILSDCLVTLGIFISTYGISFLYSTTSYQITGSNVVIKRPGLTNLKTSK